MQARRAALDVLAAVRSREAYANLVLPSVLAQHALNGPTAARATDLAYGTLRGLGTLDRVIEACSSRALTSIDPVVLDVLRLGAYQVLGARTPAHAAVSTSVDLARERAGRRTTGFVNAVLRGVAEHDLADWAARLSDPGTLDALALAHQHPAWVVQALGDALDDDARLPDVLAADNVAPSVTLAAVPGRCTVTEITATADAQPGRWARTAAVLAGGNPADVPAVAQGRARVQDEGSQVVALLLADAEVDPRVASHPWLDMCAGPGGKATLLAGVASQRERHVVAAEIHRHRAGLVARSLEHADLLDVAAVVQADGRAGPWAPQTFSRVLLDAPCTGLGALRRRPEARWRRTPDDLDRLVPLQRALLESALDATAVGGVTAYATCSPHPGETTAVLDAVLAHRRDVVVEDAPTCLSHVADCARGPYVQLWPDRHGTDAMFVALLRRTRPHAT